MLGTLQIVTHLIPKLILEVGNSLILQGRYFKTPFIICLWVYEACPSTWHIQMNIILVKWTLDEHFISSFHTWNLLR